MDDFYDIRFLLLPPINHLASAAHSGGGNNSGFVLNELKVLIMFMALLIFLITSIRFPNLFRFRRRFRRRIELRFGRSGFSLPFTLSLTATLFLPPPAFWNAYLIIMIMSLWSDCIHSLITRFTYTEEHLWMLPVTQANAHQYPSFSGE